MNLVILPEAYSYRGCLEASLTVIFRANRCQQFSNRHNYSLRTVGGRVKVGFWQQPLLQQLQVVEAGRTGPHRHCGSGNGPASLSPEEFYICGGSVVGRALDWKSGKLGPLLSKSHKRSWPQRLHLKTKQQNKTKTWCCGLHQGRQNM